MIHPFPVMMVVAFTTILALATARNDFDLARIARIVLALFLSQVVVGVSNDYHDRMLDAQGQPWKPLARGIVTPNEARLLIAVAFGLMCLVALSLGPIPLLLILLGTLAGQLYNFVFRETPFSWFPYVIGFVTLPLYIWVALEHFDARQLLLVPIGMPLLFGVHLAQTLPDVEIDATHGARGFAVTLGRARGVIFVWCAMLGAQFTALITAMLFGLAVNMVAMAVALSFALLVASIALYQRTPTSHTLRLVFRLIAPAAVILVAGWLLAL